MPKLWAVLELLDEGNRAAVRMHFVSKSPGMDAPIDGPIRGRKKGRGGVMAIGMIFKIPGRKTFAVIMPSLESAEREARIVMRDGGAIFAAVVKADGRTLQRIRAGGMHEKKKDIFG